MTVELPPSPYYQAGHPSAHDVAVWHACQINELFDAGDAQRWPHVPTSFAPAFAPDEHMFGAGWFTLHDHGALGDGSYTQDDGFFFATGNVGLALTAGAMAGRAIGNASRRRAAEQAAQERWKELERGQFWVSDYGFYFLTESAQFFSWDFGSIRAMQLIGPATLWFSGESSEGAISWVLTSDWAELVFTFWCRIVHPRHQQFAGGAWVPPGWRDRIIAMAVPLPAHIAPGSELGAILS